MSTIFSLIKKEDFLFKFFLLNFIVFFFIPKGNAVEWICILGLLILSIKSVKDKTFDIDKSIYKDTIFILILFFTIFQLISSFFAYDVIDALYQYKKDFLQPILIGIFILIFYKKIDFLYIYKTMTVALLVLGIWYFYETYMLLGYLDFNNIEFYTPRDATFTIPILFPFVIFGLYEFYKNKYYSFIALIAMSLAILIVVYSGSRGAVLAFSVEIIVFILFTILSKNWKYIIFPIIFGLILLFMMSNDTISKKAKAAVERGIDSNGRLTTMNNFKEAAFDHVLFGIGIGVKNTDIVIRNYNITFCVGKNVDGNLTTGPHNTFIKVLYQNGIFSLFCYLAIILVVVFRTFKYKKFINQAEGKLAFALVSIFLDHFVLRGSVEDLKLGKFYLIVFITIALYNTTLKSKENENSLHIS